jgi:hypothetical protein
MGNPQPPRMAVSTSSTPATPDSTTRMALFRYGKRSALTMKPARSFTSTGSLPTETAKSLQVDMVSSLAVSGRTTSTRLMTGAGLKKWTPQTLSGGPVSMASSMTGSVDVLVARMVASAQIRSRSLKRCRLAARFSTIDSITRSQSASSARSEVTRTLERAVVRTSSVSLPRSTCLASDFSRAASMASAAATLRDRNTTSWPALLAHSAIPEPIFPDPTTPTRLTVMNATSGTGGHSGPNSASVYGGVALPTTRSSSPAGDHICLKA